MLPTHLRDGAIPRMVSVRSRRPVFVSTLCLATLSCLHFVPLRPAVSLLVISVASSVVYIWTARTLLNSSLPRTTLFVLLAASMALRFSFLATEPIGSDDAYRYLWDGKVQADGISPYQYPPNAPELQHLHSERLPALLNHPEMRTIYFPVSQWLFAAAYRLAGEHIWGIKLLLLLAEGVTIVSILLLARGKNVSPTSVLLYALCPLPILQFAVDAHVDGFGLALLGLALFLFLSERKSLGLIFLGLSIAIKPVALVVLPVLFLHEMRLRYRLAVLLIPLAVVLAQFFPYLESAGLFESLLTFTSHWVFNGALFEILNSLVHDNQVARILCALVLALALPFVYRRNQDPTEKMYYAVLLLLLCSPVVHPWYVTWLVLFLPLVRRWSGITFAGTVSLAGITAMQYSLTGRWEQDTAVLLAEYLPVLAFLVLELRRRSLAMRGV